MKEFNWGLMNGSELALSDEELQQCEKLLVRLMAVHEETAESAEEASDYRNAVFVVYGMALDQEKGPLADYRHERSKYMIHDVSNCTIAAFYREEGIRNEDEYFIKGRKYAAWMIKDLDDLGAYCKENHIETDIVANDENYKKSLSYTSKYQKMVKKFGLELAPEHRVKAEKICP